MGKEEDAFVDYSPELAAQAWERLKKIDGFDWQGFSKRKSFPDFLKDCLADGPECPSVADAYAYCESPRRDERMSRHLAGCERCRSGVQDLERFVHGANALVDGLALGKRRPKVDIWTGSPIHVHPGAQEVEIILVSADDIAAEFGDVRAESLRLSGVLMAEGARRVEVLRDAERFPAAHAILAEFDVEWTHIKEAEWITDRLELSGLTEKGARIETWATVCVAQSRLAAAGSGR